MLLLLADFCCCIYMDIPLHKRRKFWKIGTCDAENSSCSNDRNKVIGKEVDRAGRKGA